MNAPTTSPTVVEILTVLFVGCQTVATFMAVVFAWLAYTQTKKISREQRKQTARIHQDQIALTKQQAFIPLSEQLSQIRYINPDDPHWLDVSQSSNLLELIAVAWETNLINRKLLLTVYGRLFVDVFEQIYTSRDKETGEERGKVILSRDCPTTFKLYRSLCKHYKQMDIRVRSKKQETLSEG